MILVNLMVALMVVVNLYGGVDDFGEADGGIGGSSNSDIGVNGSSDSDGGIDAFGESVNLIMADIDGFIETDGGVEYDTFWFAKDCLNRAIEIRAKPTIK